MFSYHQSSIINCQGLALDFMFRVFIDVCYLILQCGVSVLSGKQYLLTQVWPRFLQYRVISAVRAIQPDQCCLAMLFSNAV